MLSTIPVKEDIYNIVSNVHEVIGNEIYPSHSMKNNNSKKEFGKIKYTEPEKVSQNNVSLIKDTKIPTKNHFNNPLNNTLQEMQYDDVSNDENKTFIQNTLQNSMNLHVSYKNDKFTFHDHEKDTYIGSFTIDHMIKYFGSIYDKSNKFMSHVVPIDFNNAKVLIEKFIGKIQYSPHTKSANIIIFNETESPFMGNIERLIHIIKSLYVFEDNRLSHELAHVDDKVRHKIEQSVKQFIYIMSNYILRSISLKSNSIKSSSKKKAVVGCSMTIIRRIIEFIQSQMINVMKKNKDIEKLRQLSIKLQDNLVKKHDTLISLIKEQNKLLKNKTNSYQSGGVGKDSEKSEDSDESEVVSSLSSSSIESSINDEKIQAMLLENNHSEII